MESQNQPLVIPRHPRANAPEPQNLVKPSNRQTVKPSPSSTQEKICKAEGVREDWTNKCYQDFTHIDVHMEFTTIRYRREVWLTPENQMSLRRCLPM